MNVKPLLAFIDERANIYRRRQAGLPPPWTKDPILAQYRFCNVYRNWDKQTKLIHANWLAKSRTQDAWFAMVVARLVNWWPTLAELKYPVPWDPEDFITVLNRRKEAGEKVFTGAYMVRADPAADGSKASYLATQVLTPIWEGRAHIRPHKGDTLDAFHARLMEFRDMGSFMAAQVVADVKYDVKSPLRNAPDWDYWAASGPGSRRGLNRVLGREVDAPWAEEEWRTAFAELYSNVGPLVITGQDLQNCLCEFDKHQRALLGQGTPRSKYVPPTELKEIPSEP